MTTQYPLQGGARMRLHPRGVVGSSTSPLKDAKNHVYI
jgi:hypothetical protein